MRTSYPTLNITVSIYCDGLEAVKKSSIPLRWARGAPNHYDLLSAIWNLRRELRCNPVFNHVKGHQKIPYSDLDLPSQMNHLMDQRAKAFLREKPTPPPSDIFKEAWSVHTPEGKISGEVQSELQDHCTTSNLLGWWKKKKKPQAESLSNIDWTALHNAMTAMTLPRRH